MENLERARNSLPGVPGTVSRGGPQDDNGEVGASMIILANLKVA